MLAAGAFKSHPLAYLDWTPDGRHLIFGKQRGTGEKRRFESPPVWAIVESEAISEQLTDEVCGSRVH